ncbi:MAG: pyridoxal phosphate-dependent aminotransferase [Candidatus Krumholzibacteriia bacterium]|nr:pyridoxal phosphate-dependent aminotransferase [Candidatus Latescibacterota bacterium]MCB9514630.1 pyridoxal phosphate-dependent aminotransferase [Candidatus Latescibacterota bacterium]
MQSIEKALPGSGRRGRFYANAMSRLGTETAFEVLAKARALEAKGRKIVHLEIGEPDFDTPRNIIDAAVAALQGGDTHYVPSAGIPAVREVFADYLSRTRGTKVDAGQIVITPGAKPIMFYTILACVEPGDEVLYPNPGFPIYESMINFVGAKAVPIPLLESTGFGMDIQKIKDSITPATRMLIINTPQNPTGGVLSEAELTEIATIARENDLLVLSDEIYSRIIYEGEHKSLYAMPGMAERTVLLEGHSKTYAMTGWRLGYGAFPAHLAERVAKLMTNSASCTAAFTQKAGAEALTGPQGEVDRMVAAFKERRDVIVNGLNALPGFSCLSPKGAFYVFPNIKETGWKSKPLADALLEEAGVAALSGTSFGAHGEGYLRFSYANSVENIEQALEQMRGTLERIL